MAGMGSGFTDQQEKAVDVYKDSEVSVDDAQYDFAVLCEKYTFRNTYKMGRM